MTFLTNWVFWAIIVVIIIIMAIIGYLAEGTELDSKSKKKPKEEKKELNEVEEISITEEANEPSAWTGEIKKDERHEQVHDVPSMDDWTNIPTDTPIETITAEPIMENTESTELFNEMTPNSTIPNAEPINPQVLDNLDAPLEETVETIATEPAMETVEETPVTETIEEATPIEKPPVTELVGETQIEQITDVIPSEETNDVTEEQLIEPAPIFDVPVQEVQTVTTEPQTETLEVPEEENKQETNADDIWK